MRRGGRQKVRGKMPRNKSRAKPVPVVKLMLEPGTPSPAQREKARRWWAARIAACQAELKAEGEAKK